MTAGWREGALHGPWDEPTTLFMDLLLAGHEPIPDERGLTIWDRVKAEEPSAPQTHPDAPRVRCAS